MSPAPALLDLLGLPWAEFDAQRRLVARHPAFPPLEDLPALEVWLRPEADPIPAQGLVIPGPQGQDLALWPREEGGFWAVLHPRAQVRGLTETWVEGKPFLNMLVHELRLPVTVIKGYTSLLRQGLAGPVTPKQQEFLGIMAANVGRLERLLELVGLLSKIAHRRLPYAFQDISLAALVKDPLAHWADRWAEKDLSFVPLPPEQAGWRVHTDPQYARWILHRLLENAWAYTPPGGTVRLQAHADGEAVELAVHDTGIGVAEGDRSRLFTPFFRSPAEPVRDQPGWGLALHVARALAHDLGGEVGYRPGEPRGSVFYLRLPQAD
ncbi:MAG: HAMP domain-containing histidine kinase [Chloroflexi bacterium]|nr:HAMP domain-containing histidine kinase [Chloroflexota bacterium]